MPETFTYFSVVPMDAVLEGVTIENAKYELTNGTVTRVGMISTSNEQNRTAALPSRLNGERL